MTRQEIIDSLIETGHGENILRCPTGVVKVGDFTEWLRPIMMNGSSEKTMECDKESFRAMVILCGSHKHGYGSTAEWPVLRSPYGEFRIKPNRGVEGIYIHDAHAFSAGRLIAQSQGVSDTIREIVI